MSGTGATSGGIFISYRRGDTGGHAGRLYDDLVDHFGRNKVFRDIDALQSQLGLDFTEALDRALADSDVVLVLIGPNWLGIPGPDGTRRLDNPEDILHQEISMALARPGTRVIPVLLGGATMPPIAELPAPLKPLARRQAIDISDRRWSFDVAQLIAAIEPLVGSQREPAVATGRNRGAIATVIAVLLVTAGVGSLFAFDFLPPGDNTTPTPEPSPTELAQSNGGTEVGETPSPTDEPQPTDTPPQPSPSPTHTPEQPTPSPTNTPDPTPTDTPTEEPTSTEEPEPTDTPESTTDTPIGAEGWSVTGLEHLSSDGAFEAYGINGDGVVGTSDTDDGNSHAVMWDEDGVRSLGALPGDPVSVAFDINDSGQLAGWSETNDGVAHAVWWDTDGDIIALDELPESAGSSAFGINDDGMIVGSSTGLDGSVYATVWQDGNPTLLPALPGDLQSTALDVNNSGHIVGWSGSPDAVQSAVLWEDGKVTALGELPDHIVSTAFGINSDGQVVGVSSSTSAALPVVWDNGNVSELDLPTGYAWAIAFGISDTGAITGTTGGSDGDSFAVVWASGEATILNPLPDHGASGAYAVNDSGQVVGWSSSDGLSHAVIWEPQPTEDARAGIRSGTTMPGDRSLSTRLWVRVAMRPARWSPVQRARDPSAVAGLRENHRMFGQPR